MAAFNPLQNFNQGLAAGQQQRISGLQNALTGQIQQGGFDPSASAELQQLTALDPSAGRNTLATFQALDENRQKAFFQDARKGREMLERGDNEGFLRLAANRKDAINQLGGDSSDIDSVVQSFASGDIGGTLSQLMQAERAGVASGLLPNLTSDRPVSVQSSKILDDGTIIEVLKGGGRQVISTTGEILTGDAARDAVKVSRDQAFNRKKELARLAQTIKREEAKEGLLTDQQTAIQRGNIQRLGALSSTSTGRSSAVKKATKFKSALEKGEAFSGAGRRAASFIPGVFTSQGQFDEEFNAFAEVAARQQLKASGETRPTDADVQGMKQAMFGSGRDESVNVQLLDDFIKDQLSQTQELDQLIEASKSGGLSGFTFTQAQPEAQPSAQGQSFNFDAQGNLIQ